ncbi:ER membrane protein complex subunit 1 [Ostreococcus tauri]|uniref:ER membrane protein complex subunit 1 n=1 Tax=Ostreococcus tauri TaxID=70448 RepID=A0A090M6Z2_OSTTA|nr:ER membrane protein complex subunit 1 [Ostreococcus tauri]CEG00025.1 ER membrane protein complex subunit 1 [Ostreococcus tauri]|eukprot:XP_003082510.2 ER membrane protein complex subunit 1 [Ostreococcus tauri]
MARARPRGHALAVAVAVTAALARAVGGIRVDRIGSRDIARGRIGDARVVASLGGRAVTVSDDAIASVSLVDGARAWRVTADDGEGFEGFAMDAARGRGGAASGRAARMMDVVRGGTTTWEDVVDVGGGVERANGGADVEMTRETSTYLSRGAVAAFDSASGETKWRADLTSAVSSAGMGVRWERVFYGSCGGTKGSTCAFVLGRDVELGTPCAAELDASDGGVVGAKCAANKWALAEDSPFVITREVGSSKTPRALMMTRDGGLAMADVGALATRGKGVSAASVPGAIGSRVTSIEDVIGIDVLSRDAAMSIGGVVVRYADGSSALVKTDVAKGALEIVVSHDNTDDSRTTYSPLVSSGEKSVVVVVRSTSLGNGVMRYKHVAVTVSSGVSSVLGVTTRGDHLKRSSPLRRAFAIPRGASGWATILVDEDATMSFHEGDVVVWTREEASSQAEHVVFGSLPVDESVYGETGATESLSLSERLELQKLMLKARFQRVNKAEMKRLAELRSRAGNRNLARRDVNGFRKSILALSPRGSLVAMHNGDGRTLWRQYFGGEGFGKFVRLMAWRPLSGDESVEYALALATTADSSTFVVVNQYTGDIFGEPVTVRTRAAHVLPIKTSGGRDALIVVDGEGKTGLYPEATRAEVAVGLHRLSYYTIDRNANEVRGYKLIDESGSFDSLHAWTVSFPSDTGSIVGVAAKPPSGENVHSWTRIPGDRSTLFKYLNPNVVFVATSDGASVRVTLLDGVTGRILYRVRHGDARGPVHAVAYENWVTYHYFNTRARRYAMSVLEMFDDGDDRRRLEVKKLVYDAIVGRERNETSSSHSPPPLRVIGQSYFIRPEAKVLAVTRSARGITEPAILIGTASDQVISLDKRFLDPRRPTKPTAADNEEGLIPYAEVLPIFPQSWITHREVVKRLRGIITAPADLESNVHVFAYGLDMFYARITPSASFDALDDDFNFALLSVTLIALVVGAVVSKRAADAAEENRAWR